MGPASTSGEPVRVLLRRAAEWAATGDVAPGSWRWRSEEGALALVGPSGPLWQFRYGKDLDAAYFHPVSTTDGRVLTWDRPADHVWHHGLWFSWKFINDVNYWEIDGETGRPAGQTTWSNVRTETSDDLTARIALDLAYRPAGEDNPVLTEERTIEVGPPDAEGVYTMDWTCAFRCRPGRSRWTARRSRTSPVDKPGAATPASRCASLKVLTERQVASSDGPIKEMPGGPPPGSATTPSTTRAWWAGGLWASPSWTIRQSAVTLALVGHPIRVDELLQPGRRLYEPAHPAGRG